MSWTKEEMDAAYNEVMKKAMLDKEFRRKLVENPNKTISELVGKEVPEEYHIRIIEQDPQYDATFFLPIAADDELTPDELDEVAGGSCGGNCCGVNGCGGQATK